MKKFLLLFLIVGIIFLTSCKYEPIYEFDEIPDLGIETVADAMIWVATEIIYISDKIHYPADEYWQSPAQTYIWRTGDCEDYVILALYLIHRDVGIDGKMCVNAEYILGGTAHSWVYVDNHYWDPQLAYMADEDPDYNTPAAMIKYKEVMRRATTTHKAIRENE